MVIRQGDICWVDLAIPIGSAPGFRRPCLILQNDIANSSAINTVIILPLSSNVSLAKVAGSILLNTGEANLTKRSVVNVSQIITVDKSQIEEWIGSASPVRVEQAIAGVMSLLKPVVNDE